MNQTRYLVDQFDLATISGVPAGVVVRDITLGRDGRIAIFQHPDSDIVFPSGVIGSTANLCFGIGMLESVWKRMQSPVEFTVALRDGDGSEIELFRKSIDPRHNTNERCWMDQNVNLPASNAPVQIVLRTRVAKRKGNAWCWAAWANPVLTWVDKENAVVPLVKRTQPLVILVTSDALRMDHLGCYGSSVSTPNLDDLARAGVLFEHARTQSCLSLGSYASLLSSHNPLVHKITGEWGQFPENLLSLPTHLGAWGYHTIIAASEAELDDRDAGFGRMFAEHIPCIGRPAQAGEITVRRVLKRLQKFPDQPVFLWLQMYDTHPPLLAKRPFSKMYYPDDPTSIQRCHMADQVGNIRGVETLLDLLASLERMKAGEPQVSITARLRGAVDYVLGRSRSGPDLAVHLKAAPKKFTRNMALPEFAHWLDQEVLLLEQGHKASRALIAWLEDLLPFLHEIETEIIAWLRDVVDYRFALAQYQAAVSYMDQQVGLLRDGLVRLGLDDHTTLIFTSPHGEALGEADACFLHHVLHECVLRVPLILRPAQQMTSVSAYTPGRRISGIIDLIDIYPTLLQALHLPCPPTLEGRSRWTEIMTGKRISPHPSFSVDRNQVAIAAADETHKYWLCLAPHSVTANRSHRSGEAYFYRISGSDETECPREDGDQLRVLREQLSAWEMDSR